MTAADLAENGERGPVTESVIGRRVVDRETGMVGTIVAVGEDHALTGVGRDDMVSVDWDDSIVEPESLRAYDEATDG
jgi:hypothetical protein